MKLNTNTQSVTGQGFNAVTDFTVEVNSKTFKVLSDTIYKDKIGSIVRELSCNAFDSHTVAGIKDKPFDIHLPDAFEPYFSIRDYGTGISPEDIIRVYTSYFTSTKDQSNDEVGAFGLGSKTPFSYTDAFTVISIYEGKKTIYNAHVSNGLPSIVAYGDPEPTDEPNGLEVTVSVETLDYKSFKEAVKRQLKFFPVKPNIVNGEVTWDNYTPTLSFQGFTFYKIERSGHSYYGRSNMAGLFLKQGPVAYPVDFDILNQYLSSKGIKSSPFYRYIERQSSSYYTGIIIDMPIGTVEVTASREGISYSDVTIRNLFTKMDAIAREVFKDVKNKLNDAYAEGVVSFYKTYTSLDAYFLSSINVDELNKLYPRFYFSGNGSPMLKVDNKFNDVLIQRYDLASYKKPKVISRLSPKVINKDDKFVCKALDVNTLFNSDSIFYKDVKTNFVGRIEDNATGSNAVLLSLPDNMTLDQFLAFVDNGIEVNKLSDLPAPTTNRKSGGNGGHSITGGCNRVWFDIDLSDRSRSGLMYGFEKGLSTLYRLNAKQVFGESIDKKVEEGVEYVYFLTFNNKVDSSTTGIPSNSSEEVRAFVNWLNSEGYRVVAINKKDEKEALATGRFTSIKDMWSDRKNTFHNALWEIVKAWMVDTYKAKCKTAFYMNYHHYRRRLSMAELCEAMNEIGIDTSSIDIDTVLSWDNTGHNSIDSFVWTLFSNTNDNNHVEIAQKFKDVERENTTVEKVEDILKQAGITLDVKYSDIQNAFIKLFSVNVHRIVLHLLINEGSVSLDRMELADPYNDDDEIFTSDMIKERVKNAKSLLTELVD